MDKVYGVHYYEDNITVIYRNEATAVKTFLREYLYDAGECGMTSDRIIGDITEFLNDDGEIREYGCVEAYNIVED